MMFLTKTAFLTVLSVFLISDASAVTLTCTSSSIQSNSNGYQGTLVSGCTGNYIYRSTPVAVTNSNCGNTQLNVALYVDKTYIGYVTVGPGQTKSITPTIPGQFEVRASFQSGYVSYCQFKVEYIY